MKRNIISKLLTLVLTGAAAVAPYGNAAINPDLQMVGLALHQETGRSIFLGALYADDPTFRPQDYSQSEGAQVLEHRVIARRTSIRNLLGNILLQGELATGSQPGITTIQFADDIMSSVKGSLYMGDSLEIMHTRSGATTASLNGFEMAQTDSEEVFHYFLMAWTGEKGPSTAFRSAILSPEINSSLLTVYTANATSEQRLATVGAWVAPVTPMPAPRPEIATNSAADQVPVAETAQVAQAEADSKSAPDTAHGVPEAGEAEARAAAPAAAVATVVATGAMPTAGFPPQAVAGKAPGLAGPASPGPSLATTGIVDSASSEPLIPAAESAVMEIPLEQATEEPVQVALATVPQISEPDSASDIQAIDVIEYSQRLGQFNTALIKRVYAQIHYPRSAVRRNIQGALELDVTLRRDGSLVGIEVAQSSGYTMLDKSALGAARKALASGSAIDIDPVAVAEYGDEGELVVVPVPVSFILTE